MLPVFNFCAVQLGDDDMTDRSSSNNFKHSLIIICDHNIAATFQCLSEFWL